MKPKKIAVIMGGGRGTRLHPLTAERCKPAVPLAGKYRLVDIPISNCLHCGIKRIYVLTQFNTASLHRHIQNSYKFDHFGGGFVDILSAEQTQKGDNWYQGTADAVRQNLHHFHARDDDLMLILSGDQLYQMDLHEFIRFHQESGAGVTIAAKAIPISACTGFGLLQVDREATITRFVEKPTDPEVIASLAVPQQLLAGQGLPEDVPHVLANMGIYCFRHRELIAALDNGFTDFGREVIPHLLGKLPLKGYIFAGFWEDIGTVRAFFDANLSLTDTVPPFNLFDGEHPVFTRARFLPPCKINTCRINRAIVAEGSILTDCDIERAVIGVRSVIGAGSSLRNVIMMGADAFETNADRAANAAAHLPDVGIGRGCQIEDAIIDKSARIGHNVHLSPRGKPDHFQAGDVYVRDGILIVMKQGVIPDGTVV